MSTYTGEAQLVDAYHVTLTGPATSGRVYWYVPAGQYAEVYIRNVTHDISCNVGQLGISSGVTYFDLPNKIPLNEGESINIDGASVTPVINFFVYLYNKP